MARFKVGDKIILIRNEDSRWRCPKGHIFTIIRIDNFEGKYYFDNTNVEKYGDRSSFSAVDKDFELFGPSSHILY